MVQRYEGRRDYFGKLILLPKNTTGEYVLYDDYTALEQRFDALSSKFAALVEEKTALERERDGLKEAMAAVSKETVMWIDAVAELKAENATLRKRLEEMELKEG